MSRGNRLAFLTLGFSGTLAIIGAGFSAWVFVGDMEPISKQVDAGISITEHLEVGRLQLVAEKEARQETWPGRDLYDYSIVNDTKYNDFANLVDEYSYRKIVFSEGNPDNTQYDDGMEFLRFYYDANMDVKTFKKEPYVDGEFIIPKRYEEMGVKFNIGVRPLNIDAGKKSEAPKAVIDNIDDLVRVNEKFIPNTTITDPNKKNYFEVDGVYYSAFNSPYNIEEGLYNWQKLDDVTVTLPNGVDKEVYSRYYFQASLDEMFLYEEGMKPYNRDTVKKIYDSIIEAKKDPITFSKKWRIQFEFASCLYQE